MDMTKSTWKIAAIAGILLLAWLWWARREPASEPAGGSGGKGPGRTEAIDLGARLDATRLRPEALRLAGRAAIAGRVREPGGRPVAGATVCAGSDAWALSAGERAARTCTTSLEDGSYRIEGLLPVPHFVHASAPGYVPGQYRAGTGQSARELVVLRAGQETREVDVTLSPGGVELKGIVRDHSGGELEGALVTAGYAYVRSGPDGSFSLWVAPGEVYLQARAEGYAPGWMQGIAPGMTFEIALTPESVLVGRVVRAGDGTAIEGAQVLARTSSGFETVGPALTDAGGNFRLEGLKPGAYKAEALHDTAYGQAAESVVLGLGETSAPIVIEAHPATVVEGTVAVAGGGGCKRGFVRLIDKLVGTRGGQVDMGGAVQIRGLLPGTYEVQVECEGFASRSDYPPIAVAEAPIRGLRWEVDPGQAIRGRVIWAGGGAVRGVYVHALPVPDPSAPRAHTTQAWSEPTDADGRFEVVGLLPGRYRVSAGSSEHPPPEAPPEVELRAGQDLSDVVVTLPETGELRGKVIDSEGKPVPAVKIDLHGERAGLLSTRTRDDGSFLLARVPAGEYRVLATSAGQPLQAPGTSDDDAQGTAVAIAAGETREIELVVKSQRGRIVGRVVDAHGGPLSDAFVDATRESDSASAAIGGALRDARWLDGLAGSESRRLTDVDGRFELTGLAEGRYTVVAQRRGGGEGTVEHVATGSEVVIRIAETASLQGSVRLSGGGTPEQFHVSIHEPTTGYRASDKFFRTGGAFRFPEVPRGDYQVIVEAPEGASTVRVSVAEGGRAEVQVELLPRVTVRGKVIDAETGAPVPGMRVSMVAAGQVQVFTVVDHVGAGEVTDAEGRFEIAQVPAGALRVTILPKDWVDNGYSWTSLQVQVPGSGAPAVELAPLKIVRRRLAEDDVPGDLGFRVQEPGPDVQPSEVRLVVAFVRPGGPAMQAGVQIGDEIVSVAGQDVRGEQSYLFRDLTRVKAGTKVQVTLARGVTVELVAARMQ